MSSQSPQRTRKPQQHQSTMQASVRREASPSPTLRERQRYVRTQSMPIVSTVNEGERESPKDGGFPSFGYPRPIARVAPPQFLAHAHSEKWQMTDDLAEDSAPAPGTAGVAYAGGAGSTGYGHLKSLSIGSTSSNGDPQVDGSSSARRRTSGEQAPHRASPLSYVIRKTANTSPGYPSMPSPRALKNRTPDRSLPVQEEPDDHEQTRVSPSPSSDINPTKDLEHDAEGTLVDLGDDDDHQQPNEESTEGEGSGTPRSPANVLFDQGQTRSIHEVLQPDKQGSKHFNATDFQSTIKKLQSGESVPNAHPLPPPIPPFSRQEYSRNESRGSYPNWMFDYYHNYPEEIDYYDETAYMQQFVPQPISTQNMHVRPDAPIPPTPHSQTSAPTPFRQQQGSHSGSTNGTNQNDEPAQRTLIPSFSPAPPSGTPYPYPFSHVRRGFPYPPPPVPRVPSSVYDPGVVQEQLRLQMQMYAYNNGAMSDSTLSPASTPYPGVGPTYAPFSAFLNQSRAFARARAAEGAGEDGRITSASIRSSPSHLPVSLPPLFPNGRGRVLKKRNRFSNLSGKGNGTVRARKPVEPPPRVESTQPRETSPEPSSGEETAGEKFDTSQHNESRINGSISQEWASDTVRVDDDDGEWVDEDSEDEKDMLDFEFHPSFVSNPGRRKRRWEQRWDDLVRAFQALDRETDATLVLLASPSHTNTLHSLTSRSIRRDPSLIESHSMSNVKAAFEQIANQRRSARSQRVSVIERLVAASSPSLDGSTSSASEREEDLRKLLKTVVSSFEQLRDMYDARELRWIEEERRMREEREGVNLLLKQTFGETMHSI